MYLFSDSLMATSSKATSPVAVRLGATRPAVGLDQISSDFELERPETKGESLQRSSDISKMKDIAI